MNFTPFIISLGPPKRRPETAHPVRSSSWEGVAGGRKSPEFGEVPETRPGPPTSCQHSPGFSKAHSASGWRGNVGASGPTVSEPLSPEPGVQTPLPSPSKVCESDARWTCAREGRGRVPRGGWLLRDPRPPPQERHGRALGGWTQPLRCSWPSGRPLPSTGGVTRARWTHGLTPTRPPFLTPSRCHPFDVTLCEASRGPGS